MDHVKIITTRDSRMDGCATQFVLGQQNTFWIMMDQQLDNGQISFTFQGAKQWTGLLLFVIKRARKKNNEGVSQTNN
jgi:hypothetical protein